jgi:hypothetical protein
MRKKMLLLALALATLTGALTASRATAVGSTYCPQCTYYADGSSCCVSCWCRNGIAYMCTDNYCPPEGGIN